MSKPIDLNNKGTKRVEIKSITVIAMLIVIIVGGIYLFSKIDNNSPSSNTKQVNTKQVVLRIYPNYTFQDTNSIKIALIPAHEELSREAGGWVIAPPGSRIRIDYDVPVIIENIDGKRFSRMPGKPAWDGVEPGNGIFRVRGNPNDSATVAIKPNQY